jgi:retron-type reverse transcriptase
LSRAKPFSISKRAVVEAFNQVKANKGATGVDDESIEDFEKNLKNNLYKIWKIKVNIQWMLYCMVHNIEEIMNFAMA